MNDRIRVKGARQHNLKGVDVDIERGTFTVFTGPSGSGKSSLAFDTIYAEGQRRYIESLSTYAKQFLERMPKPIVDAVEGVSPSVSIDQRNQIQSSRSTVGTITEVYDYMRLLWARVGTTVCPDCDRPVIPDTVTSAADAILALKSGTRLVVAFEARLSKKVNDATAIANLQAQAYVRVIADGVEIYLADLDLEDGQDDLPALTKAKELLVVVDRLVVDEAQRERLADSLSVAFAEGRGAAVVLEYTSKKPKRHPFQETVRCSVCQRSFTDPVPALFSFNSPAGACDTCTGFGAVLEYAPELIIPDIERSLADGALDPWWKPRYKRERAKLLEFARVTDLDENAPWQTLPDDARDVLLEGGTYLGEKFRGVIPFLKSKENKRYKAYIRVFLRQYQLPRECERCGGSRLTPDALNVRIAGRHIAEIAITPVSEIAAWLAGDLGLEPFAQKIARTILDELEDRLRFLHDVGLGYLTLDRQARTLSGGEMQRIRLASCLGSRLVDTLYVLDEPTIGLHAHDIEAFTSVLQRLSARGNTVLVVEHEPAVLERADRIVELGPLAGEGGGQIVFQGDWDELLASETSTGKALARRAQGLDPAARRDRWRPRSDEEALSSGELILRGARLHNVQDVELRLPLGSLTAVTGVSGSGKSTLVRGVLFHALERTLGKASSAKRHLGEPEGAFDALDGAETLTDVVLVDQRPIGRTPRSNPATYIGAFKELREAFAKLPAAKEKGFGPGYFSFNRPGGRCEQCKGAGEEVVEMVFLADVSVPCETCRGTRYAPDVLDIEYRGRSIRDALDMTVDQAIRFFIRQDRLGERLWHLQRVGLGYLRLGQPATTLSGGEAQRLKVARELARRSKGGKRIYILDEPTVGLGVGEVQTLTGVLRELVAEGHTVIVIEHNLDVIADADWVVDIGPGAAADGGQIVASGPPRQVATCPGSRTGEYLARYFEGLAREPVSVPVDSTA